MKISEHFSIKGDRASCHCGCGFFIKSDKLVQMLEKARLIACMPFKINSWCRCQKYNDSLPGSVPDSAHLKGLAVDIAVTPANKAIILRSLRKAGFERIGKAKRFIHVDVDLDKPQVEWYYA